MAAFAATAMNAVLCSRVDVCKCRRAAVGVAFKCLVCANSVRIVRQTAALRRSGGMFSCVWIPLCAACVHSPACVCSRNKTSRRALQRRCAGVYVSFFRRCRGRSVPSQAAANSIIRINTTDAQKFFSGSGCVCCLCTRMDYGRPVQCTPQCHGHARRMLYQCVCTNKRIVKYPRTHAGRLSAASSTW